MRHPLIAAILAAISFACFAASPSDSGKPKVDFRWEETVHDFGTFSEDLGKVTTYFRGINISSDTATVSSLTASCGCTTPVADKKIIPPGDSVTIAVTYDPWNRPGPFDKRITFAAIPGYRARFSIKGVVKTSRKRIAKTYPTDVGHFYRLDDGIVAFGMLRENQTLSAQIRGINDTTMEIHPVIVSSPKWLNAIFEPKTVLPGNRLALSITADGPEVGQYGLTIDTLYVGEASDPTVRTAIPVQIDLYEVFPDPTEEYLTNAPVAACDSTQIFFGSDIDLSSRKAIKRTFEIRNDGHTPLEIRRIYTLIPGFTIKGPNKPIAPGKTAKVEVSLIPADLNPGTVNLNARISIISASPINTVVDIYAVGTAKTNTAQTN